jgi:transposase-like protein
MRKMRVGAVPATRYAWADRARQGRGERRQRQVGGREGDRSTIRTIESLSENKGESATPEDYANEIGRGGRLCRWEEKRTP